MASLRDIANMIDRMAGAGGMNPSQLRELGEAAVAIVVARTKRGFDVARKPFKAYSPGYRDVRVGAGLSTTPDLVRTGHMVGALQVTKVGKDFVDCSFVSSREATKAAAHNQPKRPWMPKREWIGIKNRQERDALGEMIGSRAALNIRRFLKK